MCWPPWAKLPIHFKTTQELVDWLRDRAIEFNAPPQFVDAINALAALEDRALQAEEDATEAEGKLEKVEEELSDVKSAARNFLDDTNDKDARAYLSKLVD